MPIKTVSLQDIGPFAGKHEFNLPAVCLIQGGNGAGKTGLQDAIKYVGDRGHDPDMIHGSAEVGDIVVTMADDYQMRARVTRTETTRAWKPPDGKRWIVGRGYIDEICNALAFDPLRFLEKSEKDQIEEFVKLSNLPPCPDSIIAALNGVRTSRPIESLPAIGAIDEVYDEVYAERTRLNVSADSLEKHVAELARTLPAEDGVDHAALLCDLRAKKSVSEKSWQLEGDAQDADYNTAKSLAATARTLEYSAANDEYERAVKEAEEKRAAAKEAAEAVYSSAMDAFKKVWDEKFAASRQRYQPEIDQLNSEISQAELLASQEQQAKGTRAAIERASKEAAEKRAQWKAHNVAVDNLRKLRVSLAERLPIKGVTVRDGRIVREQDGGMVPLKKWNTADQRKLALRIGMLVGQKAGFVVVDHVESFDKQQRASLLATCLKYAEENGVQFILASVDPYTEKPGPMRVVDGATGGK